MQLLKHFHKLSIHPKNASELKGLILQLAMKGQLTNLYRENLNEPVKKDKIKGFYKLPPSWYWDSFKNICDFNMGKTPPSKQLEYWEGEIPWVSIADMPKQGFISQTKKSINKLSLDQFFKGKTVKKGTLLMSFKLSIGKTAILNMDACHNEAIISIYPKETVFQSYLFLFLPIISNSGTKVSAIKGSTLNKGKIQKLKVPIPPLEEQKEIVRVVEILFKEVEQLESLTQERVQLKQDYVASALHQLATQNTQSAWQELTPQFSTFFDDITNIKKLRETILQLAVQGKLTADWRTRHPELVSGSHHASELLKSIQKEKAQLIKEKKIKREKALPPITPEEIPYELPEGWIWCRIGQLIRFMAYGTSQKTNSDTTQVPVLRMGNISTSGKLVYRNLKYIPHSHKDLPKLFLEKGDLVFNRTNSYDLVGKSGVFKKENNSYTLASYLIKVSLFQEKTYPDYVNNYIISPVCRKTQIEPQITAQTNQANFSGTKLKNVLIPIPPFKEQKAIVEKVNALMGLCDTLEQEVNTGEKQLEQLIESVLKEVFEGEKKEKVALPMAAEPEGGYEKSTFDEIFESLDYDYEVAAVVLLTQQRFGFTYGKKYVHKMFSNIDFLNELPVFKELQFQENGWGMYSPIIHMQGFIFAKLFSFCVCNLPKSFSQKESLTSKTKSNSQNQQVDKCQRK